MPGGDRRLPSGPSDPRATRGRGPAAASGAAHAESARPPATARRAPKRERLPHPHPRPPEQDERRRDEHQHHVLHHVDREERVGQRVDAARRARARRLRSRRRRRPLGEAAPRGRALPSSRASPPAPRRQRRRVGGRSCEVEDDVRHEADRGEKRPEEAERLSPGRTRTGLVVRAAAVAQPDGEEHLEPDHGHDGAATSSSKAVQPTKTLA